VYHHGNLRQALLDGALGLFAERGSFDFTMRELARAVGVTHNAPYRHFTDKAALRSALADDGFKMLAAACAKAKKDDPRARVLSLGEAYVRFAIGHPHHFRLMFGGPLERSTAARESYGHLASAIQACDDVGLLRGSVPEVTLAAWSLVHGLASLAVAGQVRPTKRHVRALAEVFFDGALKGRTASRGSRAGTSA
jgi:AcrR family transcriptional regulator